MKSAVYTSNGLEDNAIAILHQKVSKEFGSADYMIFTLPSKYNLQKAAQEIKTHFLTEEFTLFHTYEHFNSDKIVGEAISVCCFEFSNDASIEPFYIEDIHNTAALEETANYLNTKQDKFHIVLAGLCNSEIGSFIETLSSKIDYSPLDNIVGGVSSGVKLDNKIQTFQYIDGKLIKNGLVILSFSNVEAYIGTSLGFTPYGITYKIKKAQANRLYSVDDGKSFSYILNQILCNIDHKNRDLRYLWYAPLSILSQEDGYVTTLRTVKNITTDYVEFFAPLQEGEYFKLSFATPEDLLTSDTNIAKDLSQKIDKKADIAFNFSCISREYVLEDMQEKELTIYNESFGVPLFGFFTFGEIGPDKMYKRLQFYNETSLAVVMREK